MQTFSPFPIRARSVVEQFDAAIKLYKQYFWVLIGWSAITTIVSFLGAWPLGGLAGIFVTPLIVGASVCCVAAAVRGQPVEFGQCWRFTQPRYWPILGLYFLSLVVVFLLVMVLAVIVTLAVIAAVSALRSASGTAQLLTGVLGTIFLVLMFSVISAVVFAWTGLVSIVICMEEDKRNTSALGRAYEILRGHWVRITVLLSLVGIACISLYVILLATAALLTGINQIPGLLSGQGWDDSSIIIFLIAFFGSTTLLSIIYTPLFYLILTVFYLDVRVRQEALDLEWTAHTTAPTATAVAASTPVMSTPAVQIPYESASAFGSTPQTTASTPAVNSTAESLAWTEYSAPAPDSLTPDSTTPAYGTQRLDETTFNAQSSDWQPSESPFATSTHAPQVAPSTLDASPLDASTLDAANTQIENSPLDLEPRRESESESESSATTAENSSNVLNVDLSSDKMPRPQW